MQNPCIDRLALADEEASQLRGVLGHRKRQAYLYKNRSVFLARPKGLQLGGMH